MPNDVTTRLLALSFLVFALVGVGSAVKLFNQDLLFARAQTELSFWGRGDYNPEPVTIDLTEQALLTLLSGGSANPEHLLLMANFAAWKSYWNEDFYKAEQWGAKAVDSQYAALVVRPAHRQSWAKMLEYAPRLRNGDAIRSQAQARVQNLAPSVDSF